jgi:ceramide glucosyltransferase
MIDFATAAWILALIAGSLTVGGLASVSAGAILVQRFARRPRRPARYRPAVTVLKPLCGDEPMLEQALASICAQAYPNFQIVFGVQDANDPALLVVRRVQERFPVCDIDVVTHASFHGPNRKISNLINMMPMARHEVLVFSDSDLHVPPDYLEQIVVALEGPRVGLVTTVCAGLPTTPGAAARLGATVISHTFLPGALLSRVMGREDCLGTTMALRRDTLARVGGLHSLVSHLADDAVLGNRIHGLGLRIAVAAVVPMTAVPEPSMRALWQHELRWARTIRSLEPVLFSLSIVQFPLFWAIAAVVLSGGELWSAGLLAASWMARVAAARCTDRALHRERQAPGAASIWLLPLRDFMSVAQVAASYLGHRVIWRGQIMRADNRRASRRVTQPFAKL